MANQLPARSPLRCRLHIHEWSGWYSAPLYHLGEWPWDTWQHVCIGLQKTCWICGASRRHRRHGRCYGYVSIALQSQPYIPTKDQLDDASAYLLDQVAD